MKKSILIVILFLFLFGILITREHTSRQEFPISKENNINFVKIAGKNVKVELALTPEAQTRGLSGKKELKEDAGMLFIFPESSKNYFWMKDMNFAIDIIWIDENLKVIYIEKNAKPESYPSTFGPTEDSKYVLEVSAYFSEKNNLKIGEKVEFLP